MEKIVAYSAVEVSAEKGPEKRTRRATISKKLVQFFIHLLFDLKNSFTDSHRIRHATSPYRFCFELFFCANVTPHDMCVQLKFRAYILLPNCRKQRRTSRFDMRTRALPAHIQSCRQRPYLRPDRMRTSANLSPRLDISQSPPRHPRPASPARPGHQVHLLLLLIKSLFIYLN